MQWKYSLLVLIICLMGSRTAASETISITSKTGGVSAMRFSEVEKEVQLCREWLPQYFAKDPGRLSIILYANRSEFVQGLIDELGFSTDTANYFRKSSAPRPVNGKLLVPPDMEMKNVFHEIVHHYLESNIPRETLLQAKWFDEGTASYFAALFNGENFQQLKMRFLKQSGGKLIPLKRMLSEANWHELHRDPKLRSLAYQQVLLMVKYFFDTFPIEKFRALAASMNSKTFEDSFFEVCGFSQEQFYIEWSEKY